MSSLIFGRVSGCVRTTAGILRRGSATARFSSWCGGESRLISPSASPWLMLPPSKDAAGSVVMLDNFYSPANNKVGRIGGGGLVEDDSHREVVGSSHGYVALYKSCSNELFLWNPVSRERINLPPVHTQISGLFSKVIVSDPDCNMVVAAVSDDPEHSLAFCCPGRTAAEWTPFGGRSYEDLAYSRRQNRLFAITDSSVVERWDLEDPTSPRLDSSLEVEEHKSDLCSLKYVVVEERSNQVFIVERNLVEKNLKVGTVGFDVYKVIEEESGRKVVRSGSLDGLVMFVGMNHSFALPAADYPELIPDSIYFTACQFGVEMGIFDYKNQTISPCFKPPHDFNHTTLLNTPFWFTPTTTTPTIN